MDDEFEIPPHYDLAISIATPDGQKVGIRKIIDPSYITPGFLEDVIDWELENMRMRVKDAMRERKYFDGR